MDSGSTATELPRRSRMLFGFVLFVVVILGVVFLAGDFVSDQNLKASLIAEVDGQTAPSKATFSLHPLGTPARRWQGEANTVILQEKAPFGLSNLMIYMGNPGTMLPGNFYAKLLC